MSEIVVNELLAFLQQKLDVMDEVSAVQICATNFSEEDIAAAKLLLFTVLNKRDRMVSRRRDGTKRSLQDIITLFKETDPDDVPTFVAKELHKLPPVTFDHVDVTSLLKDLVSLKANMAQVTQKLEISERTVGELRKEVNSLRSSLAVIGSPNCAANVNTRRGAGTCLDTSPASSFESAGASPCAAVSAPPAPPPPLAATASAAAPAPRPARRTAAPAPRAAPPQPPASPRVTAAPAATPTFANIAASTPPAGPRPPPRVERPDDDGFVEVKKKRTRRVNRNRCGTAEYGTEVGLRAEGPSTLIYLSRLHYTTEVQDVADYIKKKTGVPLGIQRTRLLESRHHAGFRAFVVRFPSVMLEKVLREDFWPRGVVFRRFRGRLPASDTPGRTLGK